MVEVTPQRIALVVGTRPEVIKLGPVYQALAADPRFEPVVIATAQHRELLDQMLPLFGMRLAVDLDLMRPGQTLAQVTAGALTGLQAAFADLRPDLVLVQGDTTTVLAGALAAFYAQIPVGHVEAGLRTGDTRSPFPEEMNRRLTGALADLHFAATPAARENLRREGVPPESIFVTGNTVIDALRAIQRRAPALEETDLAGLAPEGERLILVTAHRRENLGEPLRRVCRALRQIAESYPDVRVVYALHPNPQVRQVAQEELGDAERVALIEPPDYPRFVALMARAYLIVTDSGGVQEEAPALGVPTLVVRDTCERPEGLAAGAARLVGTDTATLVQAAEELLAGGEAYRRMRQAPCPYGDGQAAERIRQGMAYYFGWQEAPPAEFIPADAGVRA